MRTILAWLGRLAAGAAFLLALAALPMSAQTLTAVSGTITDPSGLPYSNATIQISLVPPGGPSPTLTPCTNPVGCSFTINSPIQTDNNGAFTASLWANASILPAATQYQFTVNEPGVPLPWGTGAQSCALTVTIAGASQSLSAAFTAVPCPALTRAVAPGSLSPNMNGVYISPNCAIGQLNCFKATGDFKASKGCTYNQGSTTVTNNTEAPWTAADAGKIFWGVYDPTRLSVINSANGLTTITSVAADGKSVVLANAAIGGIGTFGPASCMWGSSDTTSVFQAANAYALSIVDNAHAQYPAFMSVGHSASPYRPTIYVAPGFYKVSQAVLDMQATVTNTTGIGFSTAGPDTVEFFIAPDFTVTEAGTCGLICETNASGVIWQNFSVQSFGLNITFPGSGFVVCSQCSAPAVRSIKMFGPGTNSGANHSLLELDSAQSVDVENVNLTGNNRGSSFQCVSCYDGVVRSSYFGNSNVSSLFQHSGLQDAFHGAFILDGDIGDECGTPPCHIFQDSNIVIRGGVYFGEFPQLSLDATSVLTTSDGANIGAFNSTANGPSITFASGAKMRASSTVFRGNGTGTIFAGPGAGSASFFDGGNNTYRNCVSNVCSATSNIATGNMNFFGSPSITGVAQTAGNIVPDASWGAGAAVSAVSGATNTFSFTITAGAGPAASPTITATFPSAYPQTPICRLQETNTNDIIGDPLTTAVSTTAVTYALPASFTPTNAKTYTFTSICGNP